jgi:hypothetical protein
MSAEIRRLLEHWRELGAGLPGYRVMAGYEKAAQTLMKCADELEALLTAAPAAPQEERGWQPIETAPKDEDVLVFAEDGYSRIGEARFHTYTDGLGGWWQWEWEYATREIQPTHWMSLPSPPVVREEESTKKSLRDLESVNRTHPEDLAESRPTSSPSSRTETDDV